MAKKEKTEWIDCNFCNRLTEHLLVSKYEWYDSEDENVDELWWEDSWYIWQCRGCKALIGENTHRYSEHFDKNGTPIVESSYYPERNRELLKIKTYINISTKIESLYKEVVTSYNKTCYQLCSIGLRTLIEGICVDKGVPGDTLNHKIDNAIFIPEVIRKNLHGFRFLGNQATHELFCPSKQDLQIAILVIEDILNIVYELDYTSKLIYDKFKK